MRNFTFKLCPIRLTTSDLVTDLLLFVCVRTEFEIAVEQGIDSKEGMNRKCEEQLPLARREVTWSVGSHLSTCRWKQVVLFFALPVQAFSGISHPPQTSGPQASALVGVERTRGEDKRTRSFASLALAFTVPRLRNNAVPLYASGCFSLTSCFP